MKNSMKGALAAGAAAVLLLGGAGSLAYWSDSATVNGGVISSGSLTLDAGTCDAGWTHVVGGAAVVEVVPGDAIAKDCRFTIGAAGDNLSALPTTPGAVTYTVTPTSPSLSLDVAATYDIAGAVIDQTSVITEDNDGDTLVAHIVVTMPFGSAEDAATPININDTQGLTATLDGLQVTLTQTSTAANPNA
jgi:alternate signal-mediated exported protein